VGSPHREGYGTLWASGKHQADVKHTSKGIAWAENRVA